MDDLTRPILAWNFRAKSGSIGMKKRGIDESFLTSIRVLCFKSVWTFIWLPNYLTNYQVKKPRVKQWGESIDQSIYDQLTAYRHVLTKLKVIKRYLRGTTPANRSCEYKISLCLNSFLPTLSGPESEQIIIKQLSQVNLNSENINLSKPVSYLQPWFRRWSISNQRSERDLNADFELLNQISLIVLSFTHHAKSSSKQTWNGFMSLRKE